MTLAKMNGCPSERRAVQHINIRRVGNCSWRLRVPGRAGRNWMEMLAVNREGSAQSDCSATLSQLEADYELADPCRTLDWRTSRPIMSSRRCERTWLTTRDDLHDAEAFTPSPPLSTPRVRLRVIEIVSSSRCYFLRSCTTPSRLRPEQNAIISISPRQEIQPSVCST